MDEPLDHFRATLYNRYPALTSCAEQIREAENLLISCFEAGHKLLICGNGGSASDCDHIAGELLKGFMSKRLLRSDQKCKLPRYLGDQLQQGLPVIPLTGFSAFTTAFGNDVNATLAFAQLTWTLGNPGDTLLAISTTGNSQNILAAVEVARARDMRTIGLTGRNGGILKGLTDICITAPSDETYQVQELHLPIYHYLCHAIESHFFPPQQSD